MSVARLDLSCVVVFLGGLLREVAGRIGHQRRADAIEDPGAALLRRHGAAGVFWRVDIGDLMRFLWRGHACADGKNQCRVSW